MMALSLVFPFVLIASCGSGTGGTGGGATLAAAAGVDASREPLPTPDSGRVFLGRWKVDLAAEAGRFSDDDAAYRYSEVWCDQSIRIDVGGDGAALFSLKPDETWFVRWTSNDQVLDSAQHDRQPRGVWLQRSKEGAPELVVGDRYLPQNVRAAIFGGGGGESGAQPEPIPFKLVRDENPVAPLAAKDVEGTWALNFELTEKAIEDARSELASHSGYDRDENFDIEQAVKRSGPPPAYTFKLTNPAAPPAYPGDKEGRTGTVEESYGGVVTASYTFGLWHDTVVLYALDAWHGIKPNISFLRVIGGRLIVEKHDTTLVLEKKQ